MDNRYFRIPLSFDVSHLRSDLALSEDYYWGQHYNTKDFSGSWTGIALRSATGQAEHILAVENQSFSDTPLLARCDYFRSVLHQFECPLESVRLLALAPGSVINTHRDQGLSYSLGCFRIHIPIITDDAVAFIVDGDQVNMGAGECWYADFNLPHSVLHNGTTTRIHLVIDGRRNTWTDTLFEKAGYDFSQEHQPIQYDAATKALMIEQLRALGTPAAEQIIANLST